MINGNKTISIIVSRTRKGCEKISVARFQNFLFYDFEDMKYITKCVQITIRQKSRLEYTRRVDTYYRVLASQIVYITTFCTLDIRLSQNWVFESIQWTWIWQQMSLKQYWWLEILYQYRIDHLLICILFGKYDGFVCV